MLLKGSQLRMPAMTARIIQIIKKPNRNRDKLPDTESL